MMNCLWVELMLIGTREHYRWLRAMVVALILLNAVDGILTIVWIESGRFQEANPLMSLLLNTNPVLFISVKMLLVCLGIMLLWRCRNHTLAVLSIVLCFSAYCYVLSFHYSAWNKLMLIG